MMKKWARYKWIYMLGLCATLGLVSGFLLFYPNHEETLPPIELSTPSSVSVEVSENPETVEAAPPTVVEQLITRLEKQNQIDKQLLTELESGGYTIESPLIIQNPYGVSPQTALILFQSKEPLQISVTIQGKDSFSNVEFNVEAFRTIHQIPIYGLYPNVENHVIITTHKVNGATNEYLQTISTEPLPAYLENCTFEINAVQAEKYSPGMNFTYEHTDPVFKKEAFDLNGDIRWYLNDSSISLLSKTMLHDYGGRNLILYGAYHYGDLIITEQDLLGRIYRTWYSPYGAHHDISALPNGNLLIAGSGEVGTIEDWISELDVSTGETVSILKFADILDSTRPSQRTTNIEKNEADWLHMNAIVTEESGNNIVVSNRHQASVVKLSYPEGHIKWILGPHDNYTPKYEPYLLTPIGEEFEWQWAQHGPTLLPDLDSNPDTVDLLLFDNGNEKSFSDSEAIPDSQNYSRMVWYRIDENKMTVEQMWEYGKERGTELFSYRCGSANLLPNGNILGSFNILSEREYNKYIEVNMDKEIVFEATLKTKDGSNIYDYRVTRAPLYTAADSQFDLKKQPINLISKEVLDRYAK